MGDPIALNVQHLTKTYGTGPTSLTVLDDVSFSLATGSTCAVVGPSGSGKTTLLGLCAGLDRASSGSVALDGVDLDGLDEDQRAHLRSEKVASSSKPSSSSPTLSALENAMVPLELRREQTSASAPLTCSTGSAWATDSTTTQRSFQGASNSA